MTSLISKPIEKSKEVVGISPSNYKTEKFALQRDDYSSDDSLPDIPDIVITKLESSSYSVSHLFILLLLLNFDDQISNTQILFSSLGGRSCWGIRHQKSLALISAQVRYGDFNEWDLFQ